MMMARVFHLYSVILIIIWIRVKSAASMDNRSIWRYDRREKNSSKNWHCFSNMTKTKKKNVNDFSVSSEDGWMDELRFHLTLNIKIHQMSVGCWVSDNGNGEKTQYTYIYNSSLCQFIRDVFSVQCSVFFFWWSQPPSHATNLFIHHRIENYFA